jgi:hypothetical protein
MADLNRNLSMNEI